MNLNEITNAAHSQLGGSTEFTWECWGTNAQYIEIVNQDEQIGSCVFDRVSGVVFAVELFDTIDQMAWRWLDPAFEEAFRYEAKVREQDVNTAWDHVQFQDITDTQILLLLDKMTNDLAR